MTWSGRDADAARFHADLTRVAGEEPQGPVALAISGGPDSMAMLVLANAAFPDRIVTATVDHRLRIGSGEEAAMVGRYAAGLGVPHHTLKADTPIGAVNLQARARVTRYALLKRWAVEVGAHVLATGHHADDQAETFLMRANRGSGLSGLSGIRQCTKDGVTFPIASMPLSHSVHTLTIVRPLLHWRRATLRAIAKAARVPFVDDPSNRDDRFDRARMRRFVEGQDLLDPAQLARAATYLGEADADLRAMRDWLWRSRRLASDVYEVRLDVDDLPRTLRRMLARLAIGDIRLFQGITRPDFPEGTNIEPLLDALGAGRSATQAGVLASADGAVWLFREAPPRRGESSANA